MSPIALLNMYEKSSTAARSKEIRILKKLEELLSDTGVTQVKVTQLISVGVVWQ